MQANTFTGGFLIRETRSLRSRSQPRRLPTAKAGEEGEEGRRGEGERENGGREEERRKRKKKIDEEGGGGDVRFNRSKRKRCSSSRVNDDATNRFPYHVVYCYNGVRATSFLWIAPF